MQIYISATPDKIRKSEEKYIIGKAKESAGHMIVDELRKPECERTKEYTVDSEYDYINLSIFKKIEEMAGTIRKNVCENNQK